MKTYVFKVEVEQEEDGRWSAVLPVLPGCATWGYSEEEVLESIREAAKAYIEILIEDHRPIPLDSNNVQIISCPAVAVTI